MMYTTFEAEVYKISYISPFYLHLAVLDEQELYCVI